MDNIDEWAAWWWANTKNKQQRPFIAKKRPTPKYIKHDISNYHWAIFKHMMKFLKQHASLKNPFLKQDFISFLKDLSTEHLITLCELFITINCKTPKKIICNSKQASLGFTTWKKHFFTIACESTIDWTTTNTWKVWDRWKRWRLIP